MPAVSTPSKVLLTGGSGFIGAWILKDLLERGYQVRAAVRSESKVEYMKQTFKDYNDKLEFAIVEDITTPGAFDEAVQGVNAVVHTASPLSGPDPMIEPAVLITPAVQGTLSILKSASKVPTIERVVITSSIASVWDTNKELPFKYTEEVWNESAPKICEEQGREAPLFLKYAASKTLAERAGWEWAATQQNLSFDIVAILPTFTWGPIISETGPDIKGSIARVLAMLKHANRDIYKGDKLLEEWAMVDVRDAAKVHVDALASPTAGGQRFITSARTISVQHIYNILNAADIEGVDIPKGEPELVQGWVPRQQDFSSQKSQDVLGIPYRPIEETLRDTVVENALQ